MSVIMLSAVHMFFMPCLLIVCYQAWLGLLSQAQPSLSTIKYSLDGHDGTTITYNPNMGNISPYRIHGVLVFTSLIAGNSSRCQFTLNNTAASWLATYKMRSNYSNTIVVVNESSANAANCQSFGEIINSAKEFDKQMQYMGYPPMRALVYVLQENVMHRHKRKAPENIYVALILGKYSAVIPKLMALTEPVEVTMERSLDPMDELFLTTGYKIYKAIFSIIMIFFLVYAISITIYLLYTCKLQIRLKLVSFLVGFVATILKCIEFSILKSPFISAIIGKTGHIIFLEGFMVVLLLWSSLIASIQGKQGLLLIHIIIYGACVIYFVGYCIDTVSWFSYNGYFRYTAYNMAFFSTTIYYLLLAIMFGYYSITFSRKRRKYKINQETTKALDKLTLVGSLCFISFALRAVLNATVVLGVINVNTTVVVMQSVVFDIGCMLGTIALLWLLGPPATDGDYSCQGLAKRLITRFRHEKDTLSVIESNISPASKSESSSITINAPIKSSYIFISRPRRETLSTAF
ncbi:hypothetical protein BDF19DRAFT_451126 [Syncephalis fuscata]|nr:hypothetical protein BDF19DRAFT_451126 [Syncephalis fuscata]